MKITRTMTSHKAAIPKGIDWRTNHLICNDDPTNFRFGKLEHSYGQLVNTESFTDDLNLSEHVIGIHGYILETGNFMHVIAFNFIVGELLLNDAASSILLPS